MGLFNKKHKEALQAAEQRSTVTNDNGGDLVGKGKGGGKSSRIRLKNNNNNNNNNSQTRTPPTTPPPSPQPQEEEEYGPIVIRNDNIVVKASPHRKKNQETHSNKNSNKKKNKTKKKALVEPSSTFVPIVKHIPSTVEIDMTKVKHYHHHRRQISRDSDDMTYVENDDFTAGFDVEPCDEALDQVCGEPELLPPDEPQHQQSSYLCCCPW